jgi:hypothetical protein
MEISDTLSFLSTFEYGRYTFEREKVVREVREPWARMCMYLRSREVAVKRDMIIESNAGHWNIYRKF